MTRLRSIGLLTALLCVSAIAGTYVDVTASGGGRFSCRLDGVEISQHVSEYKAAEQAANLKLEHPDSSVVCDQQKSLVATLTAAGRKLIADAEAQSYPGVNNSTVSPPPNSAPVWNNTPNPSLVEGSTGSYDLLDDVGDINGDTLTCTLNGGSASLPTGVTLNSNCSFSFAGTTEAGTTADVIVDADDGTASPVASPNFSILIIASPGTPETLIWIGGYETGDFSEWPPNPDSLEPNNFPFHQVPAYGRPINYNSLNNPNHIGTGSHAGIVRSSAQGVYAEGPVACGTYASYATIMSAANAGQASGCNGQTASPACECDALKCERRRSQHSNLTDTINYFWPGAMPELANRRYFVATHPASNWPLTGSGWGVQLFQIKDSQGQGSPWFEVELSPNGTYRVILRWAPDNATITNMPWQYSMFYTGNYDGQPYPRSDLWPDGLDHFPDVATSHAELANVNIGGWTFWLLNFRIDYRGSDAGGTGYFELWKCDDDEEDCSQEENYTQILDVVPGETTRGGLTFNHGIGFNNNTGLFGPSQGMYTSNGAGIDATTNRTLYHDCNKLGDENSTFADMLFDVN